MPLDRREFLGLAASGLLATVAKPSRIEAVAFDAFTIFDPRPITALAETFFPGQGSVLADAWRVRQFEYQWLRTLGGRYADFLRTTEAALVFAAKQLKLDLTPDARSRLMRAYHELSVWPDAAPELRVLKEAGFRLAFLSNMTAEMLEAGIKRNGLDGAFEHVLSADRARAHKPDPRAYRMAVDAFGLPRERIAFAAFAGWDAAGATWFGYPTFWVDRLDLAPEELGVVPEVGHDLSDLARYVKSRR